MTKILGISKMQKKFVKSSYLSSFGTYSGVHALAFSRTDSATTKLALDFRDVTLSLLASQFAGRFVDEKILTNFVSFLFFL